MIFLMPFNRVHDEPVRVSDADGVLSMSDRTFGCYVEVRVPDGLDDAQRKWLHTTLKQALGDAGREVDRQLAPDRGPGEGMAL